MTTKIAKVNRRAWFFCGALIAGVLAFSNHVFAGQTPFSKIVAFGDSLTDTHRFFAETGQPAAPYYQGRFSNGPLWIETFGGMLGMEIAPDDNYAFAGATSGRDNENDNDFPEPRNFPGLLDEIDACLAGAGDAGLDPEALYVIWAGANDFVVMAETGGAPGPTIANGIANQARAVGLLSRAGARHILIVNVPDLGLTPLAILTGNSQQFSALSAIYNHNLDLALDQLAAAGITTIRVRSDLILQAMVAQPAIYGFSNVTQPFLLVGGTPEEFLFWDPLHPTTCGHHVLAEGAFEALLHHYLPGSADPKGEGIANSLKGLVNAASHH